MCVLFMFLCCMLVLGCADEREPLAHAGTVVVDSTAAPFSIRGKAFEANSLTPLAGVIIQVNNVKGIEIPRIERVVTAADGSYHIAGLSEGPYRLRAFYGFDFGKAIVESEMLSGRIYVDEAGEFVDAYFSRTEARVRFESRMAHLDSQNPNDAVVAWFRALSNQPKDLVPRGFLINDDHEVRFWRYQVQLKN